MNWVLDLLMPHKAEIVKQTKSVASAAACNKSAAVRLLHKLGEATEEAIGDLGDDLLSGPTDRKNGH